MVFLSPAPYIATQLDIPTIVETSSKSAPLIMDLDELSLEKQELKRIVFEQVIVKKACNSSSECLHHTPDRSGMNLTNLLVEQVKFLKEEIANKNKRIPTLLKTSKQTYTKHKEISNTEKGINNNRRIDPHHSLY